MFQSESEHLVPRFVAEAAESCDVTTGKIRFSTFAVGVRNRFSFENLMWDNGVADEGAASSSSPWYAKVKHSGFLLGGVDILGCCFTCSWSIFAACTLFKRTHDGLIHRARNFLHVISSCVDSKRIGVALAAMSLEFRLTKSLCAVWPSCCAREGCIAPATTLSRFTHARSHYCKNWSGCHNSGRSVVCTLSFRVPCVFLVVSQLMTSIQYVKSTRF